MPVPKTRHRAAGLLPGELTRLQKHTVNAKTYHRCKNIPQVQKYTMCAFLLQKYKPDSAPGQGETEAAPAVVLQAVPQLQLAPGQLALLPKGSGQESLLAEAAGGWGWGGV